MACQIAALSDCCLMEIWQKTFCCDFSSGLRDYDVTSLVIPCIRCRQPLNYKCTFNMLCSIFSIRNHRRNPNSPKTKWMRICPLPVFPSFPFFCLWIGGEFLKPLANHSSQSLQSGAKSKTVVSANVEDMVLKKKQDDVFFLGLFKHYVTFFLPR